MTCNNYQPRYSAGELAGALPGQTTRPEQSCESCGNPAIVIEYATLPNGRAGFGFLPVVWNNGRLITPTWAARGCDRSEALEQAMTQAEDEAAHYTGDWHIEVSELPLLEIRRCAHCCRAWRNQWTRLHCPSCGSVDTKAA